MLGNHYSLKLKHTIQQASGSQYHLLWMHFTGVFFVQSTGLTDPSGILSNSKGTGWNYHLKCITCGHLYYHRWFCFIRVPATMPVKRLVIRASRSYIWAQRKVSEDAEVETGRSPVTPGLWRQGAAASQARDLTAGPAWPCSAFPKEDGWGRKVAGNSWTSAPRGGSKPGEGPHSGTGLDLIRLPEDEDWRRKVAGDSWTSVPRGGSKPGEGSHSGTDLDLIRLPEEEYWRRKVAGDSWTSAPRGGSKPGEGPHSGTGLDLIRLPEDEDWRRKIAGDSWTSAPRGGSKPGEGCHSETGLDRLRLPRGRRWGRAWSWSWTRGSRRPPVIAGGRGDHGGRR